MTELFIETTGTGPTVVFVHGLDSDRSVWDPTIELLPDHTCVAVDLPGHGASETSTNPGDYEREAVLAQLDAVFAACHPPITVVGHSLGGYLALAHALTRPGVIGGLVLVATGPGFRDPTAREEWNERVRDSAGDYEIAPIAATIAHHVDSFVIDHFAELTVPTALVIGDRDRAYLGANDYMEKKLPHATRTTVEGARHYVMRSHPGDVAGAIRSVTDAVRAARPVDDIPDR